MQGRSPRGTEEGSILGRWGSGGLPPEIFLQIVWNEQILTYVGQKFQASSVCSAMCNHLFNIMQFLQRWGLPFAAVERP